MGTRNYRRKTSHSEHGPGDGGRTGSWRVERPILDKSLSSLQKEYRGLLHLLAVLS